jgi:ribosomal protein L32
MGLPAKQRTKTSKRDRLSHAALKPLKSIKVTSEGGISMPHLADKKTGMYKGRKVVDTEKRLARRMKRVSRLRSRA